MRIRIGNQYEDWKVLMDTGSRLNIFSDTVVSTHLKWPTACQRVITTNSEIETKKEEKIEIFLTKDIGERVVCPIVSNMNCATYLGTLFFQNFTKHGAKLDAATLRYGYFVSLVIKRYSFLPSTQMLQIG